MAKLVNSSDVFKNTKLTLNNGTYNCIPISEHIGSLPTLFSCDGTFLEAPNSYFFYLKGIKNEKDLGSCSRALLQYYQFLEESRLAWDSFLPVNRLKPTYQFRSHLLEKIKLGDLAHSTASLYMCHVVKFYKWAIYEGYLQVSREQVAPFKIEFVTVNNNDALAHIRPKFIIQTSDLRIRKPKKSNNNSMRTLSPLSREALLMLANFLPMASQEIRLQVLLSIDTGMRIQEVATLTLDALKTAHPLAESQNRFEILLCPRTNGVRTKFNKSRKIEISLSLLNKLNEYSISERRLKRATKLDHQLAQLSANTASSIKQVTRESLERCRHHSPLFISQQGNPVSVHTIESRWSELRYQIQKQTPSFNYRYHDLRATYATYRLSALLEAGLPEVESLELLMGWMGHNSESTTWKYLRFLRQRETFKAKFGILDCIMHEALGDNNE